ncbi:L-lactate dehydrogenase [Candidatus Sororendozoicomonas aggregata]|uniref:L-lactate dehydrogenase n=1 Tax=Candidatus Sororendozoicomonas aggregata TaxID=3073239 RepID=UPI002ED2991E
MKNLHRIGIVGTGFVGMAAAYSLFQQKAASELIFVDKNTAQAEGEALDMMHAQPLVGRCNIVADDFSALKEAGIVIICAGVGQSSPDESRLELLKRNIVVFKSIAESLDRHAPDALLLIASNPVDVLTQAMQTLSERPHHRVIGTGTLLDTIRFRTLLADYYGVSPKSVHAYVLGEHGDSEIPVWSSASVAGMSIINHEINGKRIDSVARDHMSKQVIRAAYDIISKKGHTNWAIGLAIHHIVQAIQKDQHSIIPVTARLTGELGIDGVCMSLPALIHSQGVESLIPGNIDENELEGIKKSAAVLQEYKNL